MTARAWLLDRWQAARPTLPELGSELLRRYAEPSRRYHTVDHLAYVLRRLDDLTQASPEDADGRLRQRAAEDADGPPAAGPQVAAEEARHAPAAAESVELAAWFHDAVYDVRRTDNEEKSAAYAESALADRGLLSETVAEVARLVRVTADHAVRAGDVRAGLLCDADLAILASDRATYDRYARQVRDEYRHVDDMAFRRGRAAVIADLLTLPALFHSWPATRWEEPARVNLERELRTLTGGNGPVSRR